MQQPFHFCKGAVLDQILFILAGNNDIHESVDEIELLPDLTIDHRISCPLGSKKSMFLLFLVCYSFI